MNKAYEQLVAEHRRNGIIISLVHLAGFIFILTALVAGSCS